MRMGSFAAALGAAFLLVPALSADAGFLDLPRTPYQGVATTDGDKDNAQVFLGGGKTADIAAERARKSCYHESGAACKAIGFKAGNWYAVVTCNMNGSWITHLAAGAYRKDAIRQARKVAGNFQGDDDDSVCPVVQTGDTE